MSNQRRSYRQYLEPNMPAKLPRTSAWDRAKMYKSNETPCEEPIVVEESDCPIEYQPQGLGDSCEGGPGTSNISDDVIHDERMTNTQQQLQSSEWSSSDDDDDSISEFDQSTSNLKSILTENMKEPFCGGRGSISKAEVFFLILTFIWQHGLTLKAAEHLLKILDFIYGGSFWVDVKASFKKILKDANEGLEMFYFCKNCQNGLQSVAVGTKQWLHCEICQMKTLTGGQLNKHNFFLYPNIKNQLKFVLESLSCQGLLQKRKLSQETRYISDITDGTKYDELKNHDGFLKNSNNFSFTFNSDGVPIYKSSHSSLWPIMLVLNELHPKTRIKNIILAGLWFGNKEPNMQLFLRRFVDIGNELYNEGIVWVNNKQEKITSKFVFLCCCVDSVARPIMQNMTQFNGYFGCGWCYHKGEYIEGSMKYPTANVEIDERLAATTVNEMRDALIKNKPIHGVKGLSPLINLIKFDIIWGFTPDYMHNTLLGVVKTLTNLWLESPGMEYYIGDPSTFSVLNKKLTLIKMPRSIQRHPRSLQERKYFKASEWLHWLLFYSIPCLKGLLPKKYLKHFASLSISIFTLSKTNILQEEIDEIEQLMVNFVETTQELYGRHHMTYNLHSLLHLCKSVRSFGPLWAHSGFVFESENGLIKKLVKGTTSVAMQVATKFTIHKWLQSTISIHNIPKKTVDFINQCHGFARLSPNHVHYTQNAVMIGNGDSYNCENNKEIKEFQKLKTSYKDDISIACFERMVVAGELFTSIQYERAQKTNDCCVVSQDGTFGLIEKIIQIKSNDICHGFVFIKKLLIVKRNILQSNYKKTKLKHIQKINFQSERYEFIPTTDIKEKLILMQISDGYFVSTFPNRYEAS